MMDLCVIGLGYVGLPTATVFAQAGLRVLGVDVNATIVDAVNRGECPVEEPGLPDLVKSCVSSGRLAAAGAPVPAHGYIISVGTPVDATHRPDLAAVLSAAKSVGSVLGPGSLVVVESTVPPGTTGGIVRAALESASGLVAGRDFHLAHCAERMIPGHALREIVGNDRLVGGIDPASTRAARDLYAFMVTGKLLEANAVTSELVKLAENTYRDVNIALANELARLCERVGANVWDVIALANHHPRVNVHSPGPGVGGHCIPVVPWFLVAASPDDTKLIALAREVNDEQVQRVAARVRALLGSCDGKRVAVLGVAYKSGTDDARSSPATPVIESLTASGVDVRAVDPHVKRYPHPLLPIENALDGADLILVLNDEHAFAGLDPEHVATLVRGRVVLDARRVLDAERWRSAGFTVHVLGVGDGEA